MEESKKNDMSDEISDHYEDGFDEEDEIDNSHQNIRRKNDGDIIINKKSNPTYQKSNDEKYKNYTGSENAYSSSTLDLISDKNKNK